MKCALLGIYGIIFTFIFIGWSECGRSAKRLQEFQRQIGSDLIGIKKQHPKTQMQVYTVLDQLSKYYAFSKNVISKKKRYKKLLKSELSQTELLKKDVCELKKKCSKMRQAIVVAGKKLESYSSNTEKILHERDCLVREKERWELERSALVQERDALMQARLDHEKEQKENSISAPRSPR